tara:strand:+ start:216 stop:449 length:234 start_codon:yes stop_codon:yes gene_type:complete
MSIKVSKYDSLFILDHINLPENLRDKLEKIESLTEDEADDLRDLCGEKLQDSGFDLDYKPNQIGKRLESLMDKLFIG